MRRTIRCAFAVFLFFAALMATASILGRFNPIGDVPLVREKWAYYGQHKDEFDTLFIGTSRTYWGIDSKAFDKLTADAGVPTRTFNFGISGMFAPEDDYVRSQILANPPKNLRWVFIEFAGFLNNFTDREPDNVRSVYWHDWTRTSLATRLALWPKKKPVKWKAWFKEQKTRRSDAWIASTHVRLFFQKSLTMGSNSIRLTRLFLDQPLKTGSVVGSFGFVPTNIAPFSGKEKDRYLQDVAKLRQTPGRVVTMDSYAEEALRRTVKRVRQLGATPVLFLAPTTRTRRDHPKDSMGLPTLDFSDVQTYPDLYTEQVRVDGAHLNLDGAEVFTRHVAERFIELARSQSTPK